MENTKIYNPAGMPNSRKTEIQVLSDLINAPRYIPIAGQIINDASFSDERLCKAWRTINEMSEAGELIDPFVVSNRIDRETLLAIAPTLGEAPTELILRSHCETLKNLSSRILIFKRASEMLRLSSSNDASLDELLSLPERLNEELETRTARDSQSLTLAECIAEWADDMEAYETGRISKVPTGFPHLDRILNNGFDAGNLVIISARPSVGKTALSLQLAKTAGERGIPTTFYSLEMTNKQIAQRYLFSTGRITPAQVKNNKITWPDFEKANDAFRDLPIMINNKANTIEAICNDIISAHHRHECDIAFIDYLGRIPLSPKTTTSQGIAEITSRLKRVAISCNIPVVVLCQLNRNSANENRPPELSDLRDSGAIEQDADIVFMLERKTRNLSDHNLNLYVRKNRQGEADILVELRGNETFDTFVEA